MIARTAFGLCAAAVARFTRPMVPSVYPWVQLSSYYEIRTRINLSFNMANALKVLRVVLIMWVSMEMRRLYRAVLNEKKYCPLRDCNKKNHQAAKPREEKIFRARSARNGKACCVTKKPKNWNCLWKKNTKKLKKIEFFSSILVMHDIILCRHIWRHDVPCAAREEKFRSV